MSETVQTLDGITTGTWRIHTNRSIYTVDLDQKLAMRNPGKTSRPLVNDGEWFKILGLFCEVGPGMSIICDGPVASDLSFLLQSSRVLKIEKVGQ